MKFKIICVGKLKEKYFVDAAHDYAAKISRSISLEIIELPEDSSSDSALANEAKLILPHIGKRDFVICAAIEGKKLSSSALADFIKQKASDTVTFVIGGPFGLSSDVKSKANLLFSFSDLTFTHRLARLILLDTLLSLRQV